jgi:hypothetical protein
MINVDETPDRSAINRECYEAVEAKAKAAPALYRAQLLREVAAERGTTIEAVKAAYYAHKRQLFGPSHTTRTLKSAARPVPVSAQRKVGLISHVDLTVVSLPSLLREIADEIEGRDSRTDAYIQTLEERNAASEPMRRQLP